MGHAVKLEVFEGPIDLLLHLITRRRVDIYDVPLAAIAAEYLEAVSALEDDLDLEAATGFLVVAATLLELKSARLLPVPDEGPGDAAWLEERDLLLARLVECATLRAAGAFIAAGLERGGSFHARRVTLEPRFAELRPDVLAGTLPVDLARAAARALEAPPAPELDVSHVAPIVASVRAAIVEVAAGLRDHPEATFRDLCATCAGKMEVVVRFLALLELFKAGAIELLQAQRFGDIAARWTGEVETDEVVEDVEEYALEGDA
ncbi:MAG: ScpA family protein [Actinomycetota bacterium]